MTFLLSGPGRLGIVCVLVATAGCYRSHMRPGPDASAPDAPVRDAPRDDAPDAPRDDAPDGPDAPEGDAPRLPSCFDEAVVAVVDTSGRSSIVPLSVSPIEEGWLVTYQHHTGHGAARLDHDGHLIDDFRPYEAPEQVIRIGDAWVALDSSSVARAWWTSAGLTISPRIATGRIRASEVVGDVLRLVVADRELSGTAMVAVREVRAAGTMDLSVAHGALSVSPIAGLGDLEYASFLLGGEVLTIAPFRAPDGIVRLRRYQMDLSMLTASGGAVAVTSLDEADWTEPPAYLLSSPIDDRVVSFRFDEAGTRTTTLETLPRGSLPGAPRPTWPLGSMLLTQVLLEPERFTLVGEGGTRTYSRDLTELVAEVPIDPHHEWFVRAGRDGDVLAVVYAERDELGAQPRLRIRCTTLPTP